MTKKDKNPKGGLTAEGRRSYNRKEGSHLKAGVTGAADTPEKMKRKGSFLRRHFANPRGPMVGDNGKPTRLALSAHAWGEPVPKTAAAARKLAKKGETLLKKYHAAKDKKATNGGKPTKASKAKKKTAKKKTTKKTAKKKS